MTKVSLEIVFTFLPFWIRFSGKGIQAEAVVSQKETDRIHIGRGLPFMWQSTMKKQKKRYHILCTSPLESVAES